MGDLFRFCELQAFWHNLKTKWCLIASADITEKMGI
jgi:hypothetical protein